ncbi:unnamed protein product, partial [Rotaria sp. Silwood2]
ICRTTINSLRCILMAGRYRWSSDGNNTEHGADENMKPILNVSGHEDVDHRFIDKLAHYVFDLDEREVAKHHALDDEVKFLRDLCRRQGDVIDGLKENVGKLRILTKKMEELLHLIVQSS